MNNIFEIREKWAKNDAIRDEGLVTPDNIQRFDNIVYGPYRENVLDVYQPIGTDHPLPTIISIHGGGWCYGDKNLYQHYCMRLAQRGFTVVNFTYRLAPEYKFPSPIEDIFNVFHWVQQNHSLYNIDYNNLFVVGDSAGGQLAAQTCTILTNPDFAKLFDVTIPEGFHFNAAGLNCGRYNVKIRWYNKHQYKKSFFGAYLSDLTKKTAERMDIYKYITSEFTPSYVMYFCQLKNVQKC